MKKDIIFGHDAISRLCEGVKILEETVGCTLGPGGRNVIFNTPIGFPLVTKDGVTVAREIELADKWQNIGVQMVKQVANQTCADAGDGTTTATVLAKEILSNGVTALHGNYNPISIQRGIDKAVDTVVDYIESNIKIDIKNNPEKVRDVAMLSTNWDPELGNVVAEAFLEVGLNGSIEVGDSDDRRTFVEYQDGIKLERGFINPIFASNKSTMKTDFKNPRILMLQGEFNYTSEFVNLLSTAIKENVPMVIIADSFGNDFLSFMALNMSKNPSIQVTCLKAPHYQDMRLNTMNDFAVLFDTQYFNFSVDDIMFDEVDLSMLGTCDRVVQNSQTTTFIGHSGDEDAIQELLNEITALANDTEASELMRGNAQLRIRQILSKSATIRVGSSSEVENNEKRDRIDDAIHAVRAAMKEGIVPGGSYSYIKASVSKELKSLISKCSDEGERRGMEIVRQSLLAPFKRLMSNAGLEHRVYEVLSKIIKSKRQYYGFNVKKQTMCNLIDDGVVDPWAVTKSALRNASSVTGRIMSAHAVVTPSTEVPYAQVVTPNIPSL